IDRHGMEFLARHARYARPKRSHARLADLGIVSRLNIDMLPLRPLADVRLRHAGDLGLRPVWEMQLPLQPERGGPGDKVRTMSRAGLESELEHVRLAAVTGDGPLPQIFEKA